MCTIDRTVPAKVEGLKGLAYSRNDKKARMSRDKSKLRRVLFAPGGPRLDLEGIGMSVEAGVLNMNIQNLLNILNSTEHYLSCFTLETE